MKPGVASTGLRAAFLRIGDQIMWSIIFLAIGAGLIFLALFTILLAVAKGIGLLLGGPAKSTSPWAVPLPPKERTP